MAQDLPVFLSLGAGVQSSTLALMAACGQVTPMPEAAIFADTQNEPHAVYSWLDFLETKLPFPVHRVTAGDLAKDALIVRTSKVTGRPYMRNLIPAHLGDGETGMLRRSCSRDYKIRPITRKVRSLIGRHRSVQWIGISLDEAHRMKPSRDKWITNEWPLIDKRMTRQDCYVWLTMNGYDVPPRSACTFCPFHSDDEWKRLRDTAPQDFESAARFEDRLQDVSASIPHTRGTPYMWSGLKRLREATFDGDGQLNLFGNECEGICGV